MSEFNPLNDKNIQYSVYPIEMRHTPTLEIPKGFVFFNSKEILLMNHRRYNNDANWMSDLELVQDPDLKLTVGNSAK